MIHNKDTVNNLIISNCNIPEKNKDYKMDDSEINENNNSKLITNLEIGAKYNAGELDKLDSVSSNLKVEDINNDVNENAENENKNNVDDKIEKNANEIKSNRNDKKKFNFFRKNKNKVLEDLEKKLIKPSPPLPMVKFDSNGDFFKEPLEG